MAEKKFKDDGRRFIRADVEGQGVKWVDVKAIAGSDYDPEVVKMGGSEYFLRFIHRSLYAQGLGISPGNYFEWGVRTHTFWADLHHAEQFPLLEAPGRVPIPTYVFMITKIGGKDFKWSCYAVVEEVLRGGLVRYEAEYIEEYGRQIRTGILDKLEAQ